MKRGASRMVAAEPARAPTSALITTMPRMPIRRRGWTGFSTGRGDKSAGFGQGGGYLGSLRIELSPILCSPVLATGQRKPRKEQPLRPPEVCLLVASEGLRIGPAGTDRGV